MAATKTARKAPAKKAPAAKTAAKTKPAPKAKTAKPAAQTRRVTALPEKFTKSQILTELSTNTGLSKRQVAEVLDELSTVIERHIKKRAVGEFTMPGLFKIKTVEKPARKARKGLPETE